MAEIDGEELREHLLREHGRHCTDLIGLSDAVLADLHALDHIDEHLHLTASAHVG